MKKQLLILFLSFFLLSCNWTTSSQDKEMLQQKFPSSIIYCVEDLKYIIVDSIGNVYDVRIKLNGKIKTKVIIYEKK